MSLEIFTNYATTTVTSGGTTAPAGGTVETWTVASTASFPSASASAGTTFHVSDPALPTEMVLVTNVSGTTWTVTRGSEGSTPVAHTSGFTIKQVVTAGFLGSAVSGIPLAGPSVTEPVIFQQADGSLVVLPLSVYGISGDDSTWINNAFTFLPTITGGGSSYGGSYNGPWIIGTVKLLAADYTITSGIVAPLNSGATINLVGHGPGTRLFVGSGAVGFTSHVAMGGPQAGFPAQQVMGRLQYIRFDGSNGGAAGVEIGGGWGRTVDVQCVNFNTTSTSIGLHLNNATNAVAAEWTEKCRIRADLLQNTIGCLIENTSSNTNSDSFEYDDIDLYIIATNSSTNPSSGLILQGGAYLSGGSVRIRGNFPAFSGPVLWIKDGAGGSGSHSKIFHDYLDITVESNAVSNIPQTVKFGASTNTLTNCTGMLTFQFATWVTSNAGYGQVSFAGDISGDSTLTAVNAPVDGWYPCSGAVTFTPANPTGTVSNTAPVMMGLGRATGGQATIYVPQGTAKLLVIVSCTGWVTTGSTNMTVGCRYGSGTIPHNGDANTGTSFGTGPADALVRPTAATAGQPFVAQGVISGLTQGTTYWIDVAVQSPGAANTASLQNVSVTIMELPG